MGWNNLIRFKVNWLGSASIIRREGEVVQFLSVCSIVAEGLECYRGIIKSVLARKIVNCKLLEALL